MMLTQVSFRRVDNKFANIHLAAEDIKRMQCTIRRKELFPVWMNVEFTTDRCLSLRETLGDKDNESLAEFFNGSYQNQLLS